MTSPESFGCSLNHHLRGIDDSCDPSPAHAQRMQEHLAQRMQQRIVDSFLAEVAAQDRVAAVERAQSARLEAYQRAVLAGARRDQLSLEPVRERVSLRVIRGGQSREVR